MGQRSQTAAVHRNTSGQSLFGGSPGKLSIFPTSLGWFALYGDRERVAGLLIGHVSAEEVRAAAGGRFANRASDVPSEQDVSFVEEDWFPALRRELTRYAEGHAVDFAGYEIACDGLSSFQSRVVAATREVPYGKTITYGELADAAGSPGAARAVGSVMANNRIPILVPCHRVLAAGGKIGGFSAPRGITLKQQMLALEAEASRIETHGTTPRRNASRKRKSSATLSS